MLERKIGENEGHACHRPIRGYPGEYCNGIIELSESENCKCHLHPPCPSCENRYLYCPECGWEI